MSKLETGEMVLKPPINSTQRIKMENGKNLL